MLLDMSRRVGSLAGNRRDKELQMPAIRRLAAVGLVALAVAATAPRAGAVTDADERTAELKLFDLINKGRANLSTPIPALIEHADIRVEARRHSNGMARDGFLSHEGLEGRKRRIADADPGIDPDKICEVVASAQVLSPNVAARRIYRAWSNSRLRKCLFDKFGYSAESAAVGMRFGNNRYYATFIAAHDSTP
jgi:uncharacterized protein YkwD